jgi:hypothetical protein
MAIPIDPKQIVSFEELLMSQIVSQEALHVVALATLTLLILPLESFTYPQMS